MNVRERIAAAIVIAFTAAPIYALARLVIEYPGAFGELAAAIAVTAVVVWSFGTFAGWLAKERQR